MNISYTGQTQANECSESSVRIGNASYLTLPFDSIRTYTGRVEVCHNGQYVDVCNDTEELDYFISRACYRYSADYSKCMICV